MTVEAKAFDASHWTPQTGPPCVIVLFGATGDLAAKKIAPAIWDLHQDGLLHECTAIIGVARRQLTDATFRNKMFEAIGKQSRHKLDRHSWSDFADRWFYHVAHADNALEFQALRSRLREIDHNCDTAGNRLFYMATTPDNFGDIAENLGQEQLNSPTTNKSFVRVVVEKPFGSDLSSAKILNERIGQNFNESQIYRIDHYLGKETVQNMLVLRFANSIFEPILNREYVDQIRITTAEDIGMEGRRGPYYEKAGALRDMVQNHMLQLLALTAMDPPTSMNSRDIRNEKVRTLCAIRPILTHEVAQATVRGQYGPGEHIAGYRQENGVDADSQVETYVAAKLDVQNQRWAGVPFYLRTGKRLAHKASQVLIIFKREITSIFTDMGCNVRGANEMAIRIYPDEGVNLIIDAKVPGVRMMLRPVKMDFRYGSSFESASPEAYEHLLLDAIQGDQTLFIRKDELEASWRVADSIRAGWEATSLPKLVEYAPGSWGPAEADKLFQSPYVRWQPV